jgi:hypothetical protein
LRSPAAIGHVVIMKRPSVILIRQTGEPGGGCCRIPHDSLLTGTEDPAFADARAVMDCMGVVYRALRERFGQAVDIQVVDPRNIALWTMIVRDFFAHGVGLGEGLRTFARIPMHGVVVNGRIVDDSSTPDAIAIVDLVASVAEQQLAGV